MSNNKYFNNYGRTCNSTQSKLSRFHAEIHNDCSRFEESNTQSKINAFHLHVNRDIEKSRRSNTPPSMFSFQQSSQPQYSSHYGSPVPVHIPAPVSISINGIPVQPPQQSNITIIYAPHPLPHPHGRFP